MGTYLKIGKLLQTTTAFFCCDIQTLFSTIIDRNPRFLVNAERMIKAHQILNMPLIVTEQNPSKLGPTLLELHSSESQTFSKTLFSMCTEEVLNHMKVKLPNVESVVIFGLEAHICVQQTVLDLLENNFKVHVVSDAVLSRDTNDKSVALDRMRDAGAHITTVESVLFSLMRDYQHPKFKQIQNLIK